MGRKGLFAKRVVFHIAREEYEKNKNIMLPQNSE